MPQALSTSLEALERRAHFASSPAVVVTIDPPPVGLSIVDSADFDRDGQDDLLLRNPASGDVVIWLMNGLNANSQFVRKQEVLVTTVSPEWQLVAAGDLNGDDGPDLLWHHPTLRATNVFLMGATTVATIKRLATGGPSPNPWRPIDVADINNDGRDDIIWKRPTPAPARYTAWYKQDDALLSYGFGGLPYPANADWQIHRFTDLDLDGKTDAFLLHTDGRRLIWQLDNKALLKTSAIGQGNAASTITLADIDDDGDRDLIYQADDDPSQTFIVRLNKAALEEGPLL